MIKLEIASSLLFLAMRNTVFYKNTKMWGWLHLVLPKVKKIFLKQNQLSGQKKKRDF
jgi:hypothetical protein